MLQKTLLPVLLLLLVLGCKGTGSSVTVTEQTGKPGTNSIPTGVILGTISYTENVKTVIPFWAEVELYELKVDGTAGRSIAKMMVESPKQIPVEYRLVVDPNKIEKTKKYGLIARIFVKNDYLMWQNKVPKPAFTQGNGSRIDIIVSRTSNDLAYNKGGVPF